MPPRDNSLLGTTPWKNVRELIDADVLQPHFQPIAQLADGGLYGHEALIRTPANCRWRTPDELFAAARSENAAIELEIECVRVALRAWGRMAVPGQLFINLSASALVTALARSDIESVLAFSHSAAVAPGGLVVELTEHEQVRDVETLVAAVGALRRHKATLALDDFGDGSSSLRLWSELKPEIVKIDKYFIRDLPNRPEKLQVLRALMKIAETMGSRLVAEGIETAEELHLVRDLGIGLGQGWALGRPQPSPVREVPESAMAIIRSKDVAVFPERRRSTQHRASASALLRQVPSASPLTTNQELFERFSADESLHAIAVVDNGRPLGIVSRQRFLDRYAQPFCREIYGRRPCTTFANLAPRLVDVRASIDDLTAVLTSEDQAYLSEGIIIVDGQVYQGLGTGEALVRAVTEARIEAARHANPLTLLPGNIPLTQHIQRLLTANRGFVACYGDLNHFKPYNDLYGYWRGDEMILLAARCIAAVADPRRDFVGHVGGDDFVVLFQSDDWEVRCQSIIRDFNLAALDRYDDDARIAGGVEAEDRHGDLRFHPLTTMSIGIVVVPAGGRFARPEEVANAAARAKRLAKQSGEGIHVLKAAGHETALLP